MADTRLIETALSPGAGERLVDPETLKRMPVAEGHPRSDPDPHWVGAGSPSATLRSGIVDEAVADLPSQVGSYKILRELGRGGLGVVYMALRNDDVFKNVVALKVIGGGNGSTPPNFVERFRQERQILAGLDHPGIARILDGGNTEDGRPFYVMEHIAGFPIDEYCTRVGADVAARVQMITQFCEALDYVHNHAITHRDIKPSNILVTPEGQAKLVDFGIAKVDTLESLVNSFSPLRFSRR